MVKSSKHVGLAPHRKLHIKRKNLEDYMKYTRMARIILKNVSVR